MWIGEIEIAITVGDSDIWLGTIEIKEQKVELRKKEDWNTEIGIIRKG